MTRWVKPSEDTPDLFFRAAGERWGWKPSTPEKGATWIDGQVRLVGPEECGGCGASTGAVALTDTSHPVLEHADKILRTWPEARREAQVLLDEIRSQLPSAGAAFSMAALGGTCGPGSGWGSIMVRAANPVGYAEGVLHEMGHHKLRALRIDMEEHDGTILLNGPDELYESGVRKDKKRPMSAVLHAHYSYLHVTEIELRAHEIGYSMAAMLPHQIRRLTEGRAVIEAHARWAKGAEWARDDLLAWTDDLLARCHQLAG